MLNHFEIDISSSYRLPWWEKSNYQSYYSVLKTNVTGHLGPAYHKFQGPMIPNCDTLSMMVFDLKYKSIRLQNVTKFCLACAACLKTDKLARAIQALGVHLSRAPGHFHQGPAARGPGFISNTVILLVFQQQWPHDLPSMTFVNLIACDHVIYDTMENVR